MEVIIKKILWKKDKMDKKDKIIVFENRKIRQTWFNEEWWFVAVDIIRALSDSKDPSGYLKDMRRRDEGFKEGWGQIATPLEFETSGGRQKMNCVSVKGAFRLIQSIPSKKAEPFKRWLAKVGYERVQEIEDPELAQQRMKEIYKQKGYSKEWIEKRVRGIAIRQELTDEWGERGVDENIGFAILTKDIMKAAFDKDVKGYKEFKGLEKENLRDHMDDIELVLTMLGEVTTTRFTRDRDSIEFTALRKDANDGGNVAGDARKNIEKQLGKSVMLDKSVLEKEKEKEKIKIREKEKKKIIVKISKGESEDE